MTLQAPLLKTTPNGLTPSVFVAAKWYAIYTRSNFEKKIYDHLLKAQYEVFLPLVKEKRVWSDRIKTMLVPLLPSYVFVKLDKQHLQKVYYYPGVVRLVSSEGKPCEIREEEIQFMENIVTHGFKVHPNTNSCPCGVGDCVRIIRGPLKGWEGTVEHTKGHSRVVFQIASLLQGVSVEVEMGDVEVVK